MSSSSDTSSDHADKDIERLHAIWKNLKRHKEQSSSKKKGRPSMGSIKNAIHEQQQKNLEARLHMTEKQLVKSRENTALLMKKLSEAESEIENLQFEVGKERREKEELEEKMQNFRQLEERKSKEQTFGLQKQEKKGDSLRKQIQNYQKKLQLNEKELNRLYLKIKSLELDQKNNHTCIKNLQSVNQNYLKQLSQAEQVINQIYLGDKIKGTELMQLEQAYTTIERLTILLRATEEYRTLADFAQQVKDIHHLKNICKRMKSNGLNHQMNQKKSVCSCMQIRIDERLLWTPAASYKTLLNMKLKYESLTQDCIEEILFQLNKIWLAREENHVRRVKDDYENEMKKLKKRGEVRYDEMVARKQIQRLKKQLQQSQRLKNKSREVSIEKLKNVGQYEDELRIKEKEIKLLQERIKLIEMETATSDKTLYLEGALWIIDKIINELGMKQKEVQEFSQRFREKIEGNISEEEWLRSFKQFFQIILELDNALVDKLESMKESTIRKISGQRVNEQNIQFN